MTNLDKALSDFSEKSKTSKVNPKLKKALKVAGTVGAIGALGAAGAIAGDALNLWDIGDVGGVVGKALSPLDKAGNALNHMAAEPYIAAHNRMISKIPEFVEKAGNEVYASSWGPHFVSINQNGVKGSFPEPLYLDYFK